MAKKNTNKKLADKPIKISEVYTPTPVDPNTEKESIEDPIVVKTEVLEAINEEKTRELAVKIIYPPTLDDINALIQVSDKWNNKEEIKRTLKELSISTRNDFDTANILPEIFSQIGGGLDKLIELVNTDKLSLVDIDDTLVFKIKEDLKGK